MSWLTFALLLALLLALSASYSGSETGVYSLSRLRLDAEARAGRRSARLLRALLRRDTALLVTLLVGNNLMLELATNLVHGRLEASPWMPPGARELVITATLTPLVLVFGELFPKDLFRRRPHQLLGGIVPVLVVSRVLLFPLAWPLVQLATLLERLLGIRETELVRALRREEVLDVLTAGTREGALPEHAAELARNVLVLRGTPVGRVAVPWNRVESLAAEASAAELYERVRRARFTRLPVVGGGEDGSPRVTGYLHQLDVLVAGPPEEGREGEVGPLAALRPLPVLPADLPVERALKRMRTSGQRVALVGSEAAPEGLVSLMDLLATISGDAAR